VLAAGAVAGLPAAAAEGGVAVGLGVCAEVADVLALAAGLTAAGAGAAAAAADVAATALVSRFSEAPTFSRLISPFTKAFGLLANSACMTCVGFLPGAALRAMVQSDSPAFTGP